MNEQEMLNGLKQITGIIVKCRNPALIAEDFDNARQIMQETAGRVQLSYKLEKEKQEAEKGREATEA